MWEKAATRTIRTFYTVHEEQDAFAVLVEYAEKFGSELVSYHHMGPPFSREHENFSLLSSGFPKDWVDYYEREQLHLIDPIVNFSLYQTRPLVWSSISRRVPLQDEQAQFMTALYDWLSPGDGIAVPVFGPSGRHGYIGIGCRDRSVADWSPEQQLTIQAVCESFHLRFCEIRLSGQEQDFTLTDRELQILKGMSHGWSDAMIGATVGIRPNALQTAIHVILKKMNVLDRPSAMLRARTLGLVAET